MMLQQVSPPFLELIVAPLYSITPGLAPGIALALALALSL
jgi:hypothetical protein